MTSTWPISGCSGAGSALDGGDARQSCDLLDYPRGREGDPGHQVRQLEPPVECCGRWREPCVGRTDASEGRHAQAEDQRQRHGLSRLADEVAQELADKH